MKQILQNLRSGKTELVEAPCPKAGDGEILVGSSASLVSAGTERMLVDFGRAGYIQKTRQQPDKVRQAMDKIRTDGLLTTYDAVRGKLDKPIPLGYSNSGVVMADNEFGLKTGVRLASNGPHAEIFPVPRNLCAVIPDAVGDEEAAFTVVGAIGLQGIRLARPTLGEWFAVSGLGLIGLLVVQILKANGCQVLGIDIDSEKCAIAKKFGAETADLSKGEDPVEIAAGLTGDTGMDGVLIAASTKSSGPVEQAAGMCRKRGRIVLIGATGLKLNRSDFYEKELSFQVSCSYGPGRYDPEYEEKGNDYPIGFVRWTEQRNFEAVLNLMADGKIDVNPLISHRFDFEDAEKAYDLIASGNQPYTGVVLKYDTSKLHGVPPVSIIDRRLKTGQGKQGKETAVSAGFIGAGNFTGQILLPNLAETGAELIGISSEKGVSAANLGKKYGFGLIATDADALLEDSDINTLFITTRHDSHAGYVVKSIEAGKHVFVEKPLCLAVEELEKIVAAFRSAGESGGPKPIVMVGFNRRFSPHAVKMKELLGSLKQMPMSMILTVNAGSIPADHWAHDPVAGGGRIVGEACHFIDLARFFAGSPISSGRISRLKSQTKDTASIHLEFENGSLATVHYFANGNKRFPKERVEIFCGGRILQLDNYKTLRGYGWKNFKKMRLLRQDKGHAGELDALVESVKGGRPSPIPFEEIVEVTKMTLELAATCRV